MVAVEYDARMRLAVALFTLILSGCAVERIRGLPAPPDDNDASRFESAAGDPRWSSLPVLGAAQAALLYHRASSTDVEPEVVAYAFPDVCSAPTDAKRAERAAAARGRVEAAEEEVRQTRRWLIPLRQELGSYDAQHHGVPTSVRTGGVLRFTTFQYCRKAEGYLVAFQNGDDWSFLPLQQARAAKFVSTNPTRTVIHDLEVEVVGSRSDGALPVLLVRVLRARTRDALRGTVLADSSEGGPPWSIPQIDSAGGPVAAPAP
jgi:hypothetical protein